MRHQMIRGLIAGVIVSFAVWFGPAFGVGGTNPVLNHNDKSDSAAAAVNHLAPKDWNIYTAPDAPTPGTEPINVIIETDFPFEDLMQMLNTQSGALPIDNWTEVQTGVKFHVFSRQDWENLAKGGACISPEFAKIDDDILTEQRYAMRVAGCVPGVMLEGESHIRVWESEQRRKQEKTKFDTRKTSVWYIAASQEQLCEVKINGSTRPWHCILPAQYSSKNRYKNNGLLIEAPTGGYDKGRDDFIYDLQEMARGRSDVKVTCQMIARPPSGPEDGLAVPGLPRVPWDDKAAYCTVFNRKYLQ